MPSSRSLLLLLPLLSLAAAACSSTAASSPASVPPGTDDPDAAVDASPSVDATPPDAPADAGAGDWTSETAPKEVFVKTASSPGGLIADPRVPRRLMILLSGTTKLAMRWTSGTFGPALSWVGNGTPVFAPNGNGGGFAANGDFYDFIAYHTGRVPMELGTMSATSAAWKEVMPPGFGSWPPRSVHVMPGTPVRVFVRTDSDLLEVSSPEAFAPIFPLGPVAEIALSPDRTTYLGVSSSNLRSCVLTTGVCTDITTTGLGAGEILSAVWFDPYDAARILVNTTDGLARHTYYSTNGGTAFTVLPCPTNSLTVRPLTVPGNPGTFVVTTTATNSTPQTIQVTKNAGATWTALKFPTTTMTDVSGLAVDAAGALFLLREGTLFSRSL